LGSFLSTLKRHSIVLLAHYISHTDIVPAAIQAFMVSIFNGIFVSQLSSDFCVHNISNEEEGRNTGRGKFYNEELKPFALS
jgi:hypothetical protein